MLESLLVAAAMSGVPLPERIGRPLAIKYQAVDPRDRWEFINLPSRMRESAILPPLWVSERLPHADICSQFRGFYASRIAWFEAREMMEPWVDCRAILADARLRYQFWVSATDTKRDWMYVTAKRRALADCRKLLSPEDWFFGDWPVPE